MDIRWPVRVTVMHTNGVDLLFVTLDTVWGTNVVSEEPAFGVLAHTGHSVSGTTGEHGSSNRSKIPVDSVVHQEGLLRT